MGGVESWETTIGRDVKSQLSELVLGILHSIV